MLISEFLVLVSILLTGAMWGWYASETRAGTIWNTLANWIVRIAGFFSVVYLVWVILT